MTKAEFIAQQYYKDTSADRVHQVERLLAYPGVHTEGTVENGIILIYLTLSDEGLRLLRDVKTPEDFKNGFSERILEHPGNHIYVFRLVSSNSPKLGELRRLREVIVQKHKAKSFSWHDDDRVILHTYGVPDVTLL